MKIEATKYLNNLITSITTKSEMDIIEFIKRCIKEYKETEKDKKNLEKENYIKELYDKFYKYYMRKGAKVQGLKTFRKKLIKSKTKDEILEKARKIASLYSQQSKEWIKNDTPQQYIPLVSSWLNANIPD